MDDRVWENLRGNNQSSWLRPRGIRQTPRLCSATEHGRATEPAEQAIHLQGGPGEGGEDQQVDPEPEVSQAQLRQQTICQANTF